MSRAALAAGKKGRAAAAVCVVWTRVSVAEARRFFAALLRGTSRVLVAQVLPWSSWRRHHQAHAKFFHYKARNALACLPL